MSDYTIDQADFSDQGKLGEFLKTIFAEAFDEESSKAIEAGLPKVSTEDELMAADDFYFSSVDFMNCCLLAKNKADGNIIGCACVNPFISTLHFIAVAPDWRRKGIAKELLEGAKQVLRAKGCNHMKVEFHVSDKLPDAQKFLNANGFAHVSTKTVMGSKI